MKEDIKLKKVKIKFLNEAVYLFNSIIKILNSFDFLNEENKFTLDGKLLGDIGESVAKIVYYIDLSTKQTAVFDGNVDGKTVQIKCTQLDTIVYKSGADYFIGVKICKNGSFYEVYNGLSKVIDTYYEFDSDKIKGTYSVNMLKQLSDINPAEYKLKSYYPINEYKVKSSSKLKKHKVDAICSEIKLGKFL